MVGWFNSNPDRDREKAVRSAATEDHQPSSIFFFNVKSSKGLKTDTVTSRGGGSNSLIKPVRLCGITKYLSWKPKTLSSFFPTPRFLGSVAFF